MSKLHPSAVPSLWTTLISLLSLIAHSGLAVAQAPSYTLFDSGPVRPMAMSPDGTRLFAVNIPDGQLEIFTIIPGGVGLRKLSSVPVGLEPVAVAVRNNNEVWVVNHLSDSVSIVDVSANPPRVVRTLLVGDEPRDIVFAGPGGDRAFITTAHRGQHRTDASISAVPGAGDPELTTPGRPRADVWVFDAGNLGATLGGTPLKIIELFGDTPRALAASPDGSTVYAAVFHSGNQTAVVSEGAVCNGFDSAGPCGGDGITSPNGLPGGQLPGGNPGPHDDADGVDAPEVGLIVQYDNPSGEWQDELSRNWSNGIRFDLPDLDVFEIDATTLNETDNFAHVGTILFNMAVNPVSGNVYVSNTEAQNLTRFEGPGVHGGSTVQGNLAQSRITVLQGANVNPRHLNKHIDYGTTPALAGTKDHSLATPLEMAVTSDGSTLYVAAFGSSKIGVFSTATLENDSFDPTVESANYISVGGGGPSGLVLNEAASRLYVMTRFDNSIVVIDTVAGAPFNRVRLHSPEPDSVIEGRPFLYDAFNTSSNGEASCSSCHIFGDFDSLAWDLGNPDDEVTPNPIPINLCIPIVNNCDDQNGGADFDEFHPMKGPMTTQTLRGLKNAGAMHWRGDRASGFFGIDPATGPPFDAELSFRNFIVAFSGLVGRDGNISGADMQKFTDFQLQVVLPPNPVRALNNSLDPVQSLGRDFFLGNQGASSGGGDGRRSDGVPVIGGAGFTCEGCHILSPQNGFFGTDGTMSFENEEQIFKIPHLRNMYQKVGMFGMPNVPFNNPGDGSPQGPQVRGTGFLHDGSTDTIFRFLTADVFEFNPVLGIPVGFEDGPAGITQRQNVEQFMLAFDTDLAPIVGQQITLDDTNSGVVGPRIDLLIQRAGAAFASEIFGGTVTECDLIAKAQFAGGVRGYLYNPLTGQFQIDSEVLPTITDAALRAQAATPGQPITYSCVPPGSGHRMALDRDGDGKWDFDELDFGTDPANPGSFDGACNDGLDNDGDGLIDLADGGCKDLDWNIENPQCDDGLDNDGDFAIDAADPHCVGKPWRKIEAKGSCGVGAELMLALAGLWVYARRSRRI